jgi:hypothetical protein
MQVLFDGCEAWLENEETNVYVKVDLQLPVQWMRCLDLTELCCCGRSEEEVGWLQRKPGRF